LLSVSRRAAERSAMGWPGLELCGRRARDRRAATERRCEGIARRPAGCRWWRAVGSNHADCQGNAPAQRRTGEGAWLSGCNIHPDPGLRILAVWRKHHAYAKRVIDLATGLSGILGGGVHLRALVRAGEDLF